MEIDLEKLLPLMGKDGAGLARELFRAPREELALRVEHWKTIWKADGTWDADLEEAAQDLESWRQQSGRDQRYTAETLAVARLIRALANAYENNESYYLQAENARHKALISEDTKKSGLREILITGGKQNRKFGIVELSARLLPVLTFTGSSDYFEVGFVPYGRKSREALGEKIEGVKSFVTAAVAEESAANLQRTFGVHYALAETSAAPRNDVPKSGKKPEVYICGLAGDTKYSEHHLIDTPFREEFNAVVRELMYGMLKTMYGV